MNDINKTLEKIQKLLNLAGNNSNSDEAQSALIKAQELMLKHRIDESDLKSTESTKIDIVVGSHHITVNTVWQKALLSLISENFRCMHFLRRRGSNYYPMIIGDKNDVEVCLSLVAFVSPYLNKIASNYGIVKGVKSDFIVGFIHGLEDKFKTQVESNKEYALAVIIPKEVKEEFNKLELKDKKLSSKIFTHGSEEARKAGYKEGKNFSSNTLTK